MGLPLLAAAKEENPLLEPHLGLMIWTLVIFVLAMWVMYKLAFKPIQEALDKRRQTIEESLDAAERTRDEARSLLDEYKAQLAGAKKEAEEIVASARKAGDELTSRIREESDEQRRRAIEGTQAQVQSEIEKAVAELRSTVADMTVIAAEKVLRGSLDTAAHAQLIEQAVEELDFDRLQKVGSGA